MSIQITSTTDSPEAVMAALGDLAKEKVVETPAPDLAQSETDETAEPSEAQEEQEKEPDEKPKKKGGFKKRIDKLTTKLSAKEQEVEYWRSEALKNQQKETEKPQVEPKQTDLKPKADDFESHDEYLEALVEWKADQKLAAREAREKEAQVKSEHQKHVDAHIERVDQFRKQHDDFDELLGEVDDVPMSLTVQQVILGSENGPELMYELAKNREELERICKLPAIAAARELGKFEASLKKPSPKTEVKKSKAPPPLTPVGSKASASTKAPEEMDYQDYKRWRESQMAR